jgi:hypothetical protein
MNLRKKTNRFPARLNSTFRPVKANDCNGRKRRTATPTRGFEKSRNATYQGRSLTLRQNTNHASNTTVGSSDSIENMADGPRHSPSLRIFVVEDHSDSLEALRIYLESFGYVILSARSKAEALKDIPAANCDVLSLISVFRTVAGGT